MRSYIAAENDGGVRLSRFVQRVTSGLPDSLLYRSFRNRRIKVNGLRAAPGQRLQAGDVIELYINDEFFPEDTKPGSLPKQNLPAFSIAWEDSNIAILYKPAGVLCHSSKRGVPSLLDAFTARQISLCQYDPKTENTFAPALCNRLDRGTEGLLVAAKNYIALRDMNAIIKQGSMQKFYRCITVGAPPPGLHEGWLVRNYATKRVAVNDGPMPDNEARAKNIITGVTVVESLVELSLCEVELVTGRTHQIRAHLAQLGTPLLGDRKYGQVASAHKYGINEQALCAWRLRFANDLPADNCLFYLAGREFEAEDALLPALWKKLQKKNS